MSRSLLVGALGLAPLAAVAQPAARPAPDTAPVPRDLVLALLGSRYGPESDSPAIVVGRAPAGFPLDVIPPDAERILGGVESRASRPGPPPVMRGSGGLSPVGGVTAVVKVPRTAGDPATWLAAHAEKVGFEPWSPGGDREGFVGRDSRMPGLFCRGQTMLSSGASFGAAGERYLTIFASDQRDGNSPCSQPPGAGRRAGGMPGMREWPALPTLRMPPGVGFQGGGGGSSGNSRYTDARVSASGPPAELLAHLAKQLADAGWTLGAPVSNALVAVQTAERRDEEGRTLFGVLTVAVVPGTTERDLNFRMAWSPSQAR